MEIGDFNKVINYCSETNKDLVNKIHKIATEKLLEKGENLNAALEYYQSNGKFETVCLKYHKLNDYKILKFKKKSILKNLI